MCIVGCGAASVPAPPRSPLDPGDAVLRLELDACDSIARDRATAVLIDVPAIADVASTTAGDLIAATVAHPFLDDDGRLDTSSLTVFDANGTPVSAAVIHLDAELDLALLSVTPRPGLTPLPLGEWDGEPGQHLATFAASDVGLAISPIVVERQVTATLDGSGARTALDLDGVIRPGDSGAPVLDTDHEVIGVVFAADRSRAGGWAIDASEYRDLDLDRDFEPIPLACP